MKVEPQPDVIFGLEDFLDYTNPINEDIVTAHLDISTVLEAVNQIARHKLSPAEIHMHPSAYDTFLKQHGGQSAGGGAPALTMGHERAKILGLDPKVHVKIPKGYLYVVASPPHGMTTKMMDQQIRFRMMQRIVLKAQVDAHARLVSIFYQLLRDHILPADLENVIQAEELHMWDQQENEGGFLVDDKVIYSNPYLEEYAKDIVHRIMGTGVSRIGNRRAGKHE